MIFTSNRVNDFKVPLGLQKHDKLCVVMDFFFFPTFFIGLPKENLITFGSLPVLTSDGMVQVHTRRNRLGLGFWKCYGESFGIFFLGTSKTRNQQVSSIGYLLYP